jgi:phosphoribosylaminoimidazole carboxylase PurE protein
MGKTNPQVAVVMGSDSDLGVMQRCLDGLEELGIGCEVRILSAHRTPGAVDEFAAELAGRGVKVVIAAAGMSAALGGTIAARTTLPVIGVAIAAGPMQGIDALVSTVQMPPGVPVGCVGMGEAGAANAAVYAAEILALADADLAKRLAEHKQRQAERTLKKDAKLREQTGR